jgi:hypothetical protein
VYAVRALASTGGGHDLADEALPSNVREPLFTASIPPDVRLFGFNISPAAAIGSPGWFFVLQEQVSEIRFGCQQSLPDGYWTLDQLRTVGSVSLPANPASTNSAVVADAVRLPPVRCAIHARALLPVGA